MSDPASDRWYVCIDCETDVRARWNPPSAGFYIGCSCTSVPVVPQMGQYDTPDNWRVKRPECCGDVDNSELRAIHGVGGGHDYECPDCQAVYRWDGCMVERPDEPGGDLPDDQSRLLTDGGPEQTGTERPQRKPAHLCEDRVTCPGCRSSWDAQDLYKTGDVLRCPGCDEVMRP